MLENYAGNDVANIFWYRHYINSDPYLTGENLYQDFVSSFFAPFRWHLEGQMAKKCTTTTQRNITAYNI